MDNIAICEMFTSDIQKVLSARLFEALDCTLDKSYRCWLKARIDALESELEERLNKIEK